MIQRHREIFFQHNGPPPYRCYFCWATIYLEDLYPLDGNSPVVHHLDEDHFNNDPANLVIAHFGCHTQHHNSRPKTDEQRANMVKAQQLRRRREREAAACG